MTKVANLEAGQLTRVPEVYEITDSEITSGITIEYPWSSHIKLVPTGMTQSGGLVINFSGDPKDGEELNITVSQPDSTGTDQPGRIVELFLNIAGTAGNPGFSLISGTDYSVPDPHESTHTVFRFMYNADQNHYIKYSEGCDQFSPPPIYVYDWNTKNFESPQKSKSVFQGAWTEQYGPLDSLSIPGPATNPVFIERNSGEWRKGASTWGISSSGDLYLAYLTGDGHTKVITLGSITGDAKQAAIREKTTGSTQDVQILFRTSSNIYRAGIDFSSTYGFLTTSFFTSLSTATGGLVYTDLTNDRFYWGDGNNVDTQDGNGGGSPSVSTTLTGTVVDIARSQDGDYMVIDSVGNYRISREGLGNALVWSAEANFSFPAPVSGLSYNKSLRRWIVYLSGGQVYHSTDVDASSWEVLSNIPFTIPSNGIAQSVGNVLTYSLNTSNLSQTTFSVDNGANWDLFTGDSGIPPSRRGINGFGYFNGHLIAVPRLASDSPLYLMSEHLCNRWGPLDIDK